VTGQRKLIAAQRTECYTADVAKLSINGTAHEVAEELITIGRADENTIRVDDQSVSGRHAELRLVGSDYILRDLGSTNGTRVNGVTVTERRLRPGDRIWFGSAEASYESEPLTATQPLPDPQAIAAKASDFSARPVDFANASPFPPPKKEHDTTRKVVFAAALVAALAFIASMVAVFTMRSPIP
jgi:pSer/pThr/pTyr-binding forkhead associated (FHA) protein